MHSTGCHGHDNYSSSAEPIAFLLAYCPTIAQGLPVSHCLSSPMMLSHASLGRPATAGRRTCSPSVRGPFSHRVLRPQVRCAPRLAVRCQKQEPGEKHPPGVGADLNWDHVTKELKARLSSKLSEDKLDKLQSWLSQTRLASGESDTEHNQTEMVADYEGEVMDLAHFKPDTRSWLTRSSEGEGGEGDMDSKMAGVLVLRLLQSYHQETGEPFDDAEDDAYWRLQGFIPGGFVEALDHDTLKRLVKAFLAMPFSMV